ncbi:histone-lysine N-methyltransferase eggless isoform X2 [Lingula anatina]|uniref:Histone-lysine N-methyltransferase eggless isoform X1 n=1 Tax=Lingula anatina TaxID=7574 RepID=A0A1S3IVM9_LINAN|nr:histone-lysine N-methyltransferase eggless isoform X1 [Lingula anatina]XP_013401599.1 histone-lysine N-methyltransferase eggless isoform X2 [Lingula anatina]|eukprot:XP_013401598.1 histone-lysine N-methyltransferase eggless isoform X1 [Lingula anatina]
MATAAANIAKDDDDEIYYEFDPADFDGQSFEDVIDLTLEDLKFDVRCDQNFNTLSNQIRSAERKQKEVDRIFDDVKEQIQKLKEQIQSEQGIEGEDSGSDDDVQFLEASYHPPKSTGNKSIKTLQLSKSVASPLSSPPKAKPVNLSSQLVNMHTQMVSILSTTPKTPETAMTKLVDQSNDIIPLSVHPPKPRPRIPIQQKFLPVTVGIKVLGKKFNDIWYKGTVAEIQNKDKPKEEHRYRVKFDSKGMKVLSGKHIAYFDPCTGTLPVGTRVVALYKDEEATPSTSFYAGIVAEPPNVRNNNRFLVFFDDGYAQYSQPKDVHKVYEQSKNVWEDIHPDSQEFIKDYLMAYPERPMVRLAKGQHVQTEWNGKWWKAKVVAVDASLVHMYFEADKRSEWIYRGSTRLEPLFTALANAEASKRLGSAKKQRLNAKVNTIMKGAKKPVVEYTRGAEEDLFKRLQSAQSRPSSNSSTSPKRAVAKKSTAVKGKKPGTAFQKKNEYLASSISNRTIGKDMASVLHDRFNQVDEEALGERIDIDPLPERNTVRRKFKPHTCSPDCLKDANEDPSKYRGNNPLLIPMLCGWERQLAKMKGSGKRVVFYRAPCARRLRTLDETDRYLVVTDCRLTIDLFCFSQFLHTHSEFVPLKTFCDIKDLSYGKETVPISCVNGIDRQYPEYVEYSNQRLPARGVKLNLDPDFLSGCDCTDGCRDHTKCSCRQLTIQAAEAIPNQMVDGIPGYQHRRLVDSLRTGIFECNSRCKCDCRCVNRVAQNGQQLRLQVFKTEKRGWGLRCLDDIPEGGFVCIYAGQLLTEQGANEDGHNYGDEYLAELDYLDVVEQMKEGYEADVVDPDADEGVGEEVEEEEEEEEEDEDDEGGDSDSTYSGEKYIGKEDSSESGAPFTLRQRSTRRREADRSRSGERRDENIKLVIRRDSAEKGQEWSVKPAKEKSDPIKEKTAEWVRKLPESQPRDEDDVVVLDSDDDDERGEGSSQSDELPDLEPSSTPVLGRKIGGDSSHGKSSERPKNSSGKKIRMREDSPIATDVTDWDDTEEEQPAKQFNTARKKTAAASRFKNLPDPKAQDAVAPLKIKLSKMDLSRTEKTDEEDAKKDKPKFPSIRSFFNEEFCYVMDAKSIGNIGRYMNHSCMPNMFVQNVFVDTHDLRFPWVAYFSSQYIRAGTELTWDYNYEVGSVPGKILYCYCGSADCRGRLL